MPFTFTSLTEQFVIEEEEANPATPPAWQKEEEAIPLTVVLLTVQFVIDEEADPATPPTSQEEEEAVPLTVTLLTAQFVIDESPFPATPPT